MPTHVLGMFLLQCQVPEEKRRGNAPKRRRVSMAQQKIYNTGKEKTEGKNVKDPLDVGKEIGTYCVCCQGKLSTFFMFLRL